MQDAELQLLDKFQLDRVLSIDSRSKSISLVGTVDGQMAIVVAEKTAFDIDAASEATKVTSSRLGFHNDVYNTFFAGVDSDATKRPAIKYVAIWPATETHLQKYLPQARRMVAETPALYDAVVRPYIESKLGDRLAWVYNILDHKKEVDRIVFEDTDRPNGLVLLPDLKWDGVTISALYLLCIVHRRDLHSLRDLTGEHIGFLEHIRDACCAAVGEKYGLARDQLRLWIHYQPSYYHLHVHVQNCEYEAAEGLAAGKAWLLDEVIETLRHDPAAYQRRTLHYILGESSDLYKLLQSSP